MTALTVLQPADNNEQAMLTGTLIIPARDCQYSPSVNASDLIQVDFDKREIGCEGLYLLEELNDKGVTWRGCRRFAKMPDLRMDISGAGEWMPFPDLSAYWLRVAGYVEQVYKPVI